jgi:centromeric protein E
MRAEGKGNYSPLVNRQSLSPNSKNNMMSGSISISTQFDAKANQHIPYRNSPLTKILRSSLGGNSRTCVIVCVTPTAKYIEQTISSLRFG